MKCINAESPNLTKGLTPYQTLGKFTSQTKKETDAKYCWAGGHTMQEEQQAHPSSSSSSSSSQWDGWCTSSWWDESWQWTENRAHDVF